MVINGTRRLGVYINTSVVKLQKEGQPTISVDTKKKELIGEYKNVGKEFQKKSQPGKVNTHDFPDKRLGKVAPYGIYDIGKNKGWVSVGISADTAEFCAQGSKHSNNGYCLSFVFLGMRLSL